MISKSLKNVFSKNHQLKQSTKMLVNTPARTAGGGVKKPAMPSTERDFDVVLVGGLNATAMTKFMQTEGVNYKMALVVAQGKSVMPPSYFGVCHGHIDGQKLESSSVSSSVEPWSRTDVNCKVVEYKPSENKVVLSNGREYTYKALVLAPGF